MRRWSICLALLAGCFIGTAHAASMPTTISLKWTAVGDDSMAGTATSYDLRYSTSAITAANFGAATRWVATPVPAISGTLQSVTVTGLVPSTLYWFAIKAADEVPNWSGISNIVSLATTALPDTTPPAPITDLGPGP